ncbi:THUMP domain-containing protein [Candidatus Nitrosocosmicus sp. T]
MIFNFLATTYRYKEDDLMDELEGLFYDFGESTAEVHETNISGLIVGKSSKDSELFIPYLRAKIKDSPWEIRNLLRFVPIQKVVLTEVEEIRNCLLDLAKEKIVGGGPVKILVEKRHTKLTKKDIIDSVGPHLNYPVNLTNPTWILLVEIIGKYSGISVIRADMMFSSMTEKRVS